MAAVAAQKREGYQPNRKFSPEQLKNDFYLLRTAIAQQHPGAFLYNSAESVKQHFDNYASKLTDSLTERQFRNQLMQVTEFIKCGHSAIYSSDQRQKYFKKRPFKVLPLELSFVDSQLFILKNYSKDSSLKVGMRVLGIENNTTPEIFSTMYAANGSDGYNQTNRLYSFQHGVQFQYNRFYPEKDSFALLVADSTSKLYRVRCAAMLSDSFPFVQVSGRKSIYRNARNRFFVDSTFESTAFLDLYAEEFFGYKRFYRRSFKYLKKNDIESLVIDLRGNGGGYLLNPCELLSYLIPSADYLEVFRVRQEINFKENLRGHKYVGLTEHFFPFLASVKRDRTDSKRFAMRILIRPKRKWQFDGKVYVLTDGGTFSAAACIAAYLRKHNRATFIGQETGGAASGCNAFLTPYLILPETGIKYLLPLYRVENNVQPAIFGRGIFPDYETKYQLGDFLTNKEVELELLKKLVQPQ